MWLYMLICMHTFLPVILTVPYAGLARRAGAHHCFATVSLRSYDLLD